MRPQDIIGIFSHFIEERTGIHYGTSSGELLAHKVAARAAEVGFTSPLEYYYALRYDDPTGAELDALIDAVVVGETYFFREADALRAVLDVAVRPAVSAGRRARIWSAACATGEEPLTLAMMLDQHGILDGVDIVATDISTRALRLAAEGRYRQRSLRALPPGGVDRWLQTDGDKATVSPGLIARITWKRVNLVDADAVRALGLFDAIVCRNVLIYFDDATTAKVVHSLSEGLRRGGALAVGASESLLRYGTSLACEERGGAFIYRK